MTMDKFLGLAMCSDYFFSFLTPGCHHRYQQWTNLLRMISTWPTQVQKFPEGNLIGEQSKDSGPKIVSRSFRFDSCERLWVLISLLFPCIPSTQRCSQPHRWVKKSCFGLACLLTFELQVNTVQVVYSLNKTLGSPFSSPLHPRNYHVINCNSTVRVE